ncbi:hypothetical protein C8F04DRAFT_1296928 [Mycena alexandri]|uniref:Uncharacterized protein n=1 Tax=Mycena alexandri TaxID=1745969 RepID=A0AAD6SF19_9AGAR|nr:hypothetical protein C8F04DRAFT_1296928 [Mycena alexandri]
MPAPSGVWYLREFGIAPASLLSVAAVARSPVNAEERTESAWRRCRLARRVRSAPSTARGGVQGHTVRGVRVPAEVPVLPPSASVSAPPSPVASTSRTVLAHTTAAASASAGGTRILRQRPSTPALKTRGAGDAASASAPTPTKKRKSPDLQEAGTRKRSRVRCPAEMLAFLGGVSCDVSRLVYRRCLVVEEEDVVDVDGSTDVVPHTTPTTRKGKGKAPSPPSASASPSSSSLSSPAASRAASSSSAQNLTTNHKIVDIASAYGSAVPRRMTRRTARQMQALYASGGVSVSCLAFLLSLFVILHPRPFVHPPQSCSLSPHPHLPHTGFSTPPCVLTLSHSHLRVRASPSVPPILVIFLSLLILFNHPTAPYHPLHLLPSFTPSPHRFYSYHLSTHRSLSTTPPSLATYSPAHCLPTIDTTSSVSMPPVFSSHPFLPSLLPKTRVKLAS